MAGTQLYPCVMGHTAAAPSYLQICLHVPETGVHCHHRASSDEIQ
jgi:hypothetical protein